MLLETAPIIFFGGKGGVGKTTLATATALRLSREHRVCLVSTDPAHNLGHIFGAPLGDAPVFVCSKQRYPKDNALRSQRVTGLYGVGKGTRTLDPRNHNPML